MVLSDATVAGNSSTLGYSVFRPGLVTADLSHAVEELAFVIQGSGSLRLDSGRVAVASGQAVIIPARVWHTVVNEGDEDLVMVFSFPSPNYPPTERREARR